MGRRSIKFTEAKIASRIRQGFGRGEGPGYKGWFTVRDFSTSGIASRFPSFELGRTLLFLSLIESHAFLYAANLPGMVDFWDQFPMEREQTLDIARSLGVRHPVYLGTKIPVVMTLDGVATYYRNGSLSREVLDSKPRMRLTNPRTREKLAIHAEYARRHGWKYEHFTEYSLPRQVAENIQWMRSSFHWPEDVSPVEKGLDLWAMRLHRAISQDITVGCRTPLRAYCYAFDEQYALPEGCGLRCLRLLALHKLVSFDLNIHHLALLRDPMSKVLVVNNPQYTGFAALSYDEVSA